LRDIADAFVETVLGLSDADLRRMSHLQSAQVRRLRREAVLPSRGDLQPSLTSEQKRSA
jgi:hypothetical protein